MSSIRAEMSGDTDELLQRLNRLSHLETRGVLNSIAEGLRTSTVERFTEEKTPEGTSWKPSIRAQEEGGKTLTKTTQLKTSIRSEVSDRSSVMRLEPWKRNLPSVKMRMKPLLKSRRYSQNYCQKKRRVFPSVSCL